MKVMQQEGTIILAIHSCTTNVCISYSNLQHSQINLTTET